MKKIIEYFYKIEIDDLVIKNEKYIFYYNKELYIFKKCIVMPSIEILLETQKNNKFHRIIRNFKNELLTAHEGEIYALLKTNIPSDRPLNYKDIIDFSFGSPLYYNLNIKWDFLWMKKIDWLESYILKKDRDVEYREYYDYYLGIGENASLYYSFSNNNNVRLGFSHKRIKSNDTIFDLYDPTSIIIEPLVRIIADYIKDSFFYNEKIDIEKISNLRFTKDEYIIFISRLLFPTYFFDYIKEPDKIKKIINYSPKYEKYVYYLIEKIKDKINIPSIKWLD